MSSPSPDMTDGAVPYGPACVNFTEFALAHGASRVDSLAVVSIGHLGLVECHTWRQLERQVADCRLGLVRNGVHMGDRIVALMPNGTPAVVLHLAVASLGAHWVALPVTSAVDDVLAYANGTTRLAVVTDGYLDGDVRRSNVDQLPRLVDELENRGIGVVLLPQLDPDAYVGGVPEWGSLFSTRGDLGFAPTTAEDPLWTSATTPVSPAQSHWHALHTNTQLLADEFGVRAGDVVACETRVCDPDWPLLVSALCLDATLLLADPAFPSPEPRLLLADLDDLAGAPIITLGSYESVADS